MTVPRVAITGIGVVLGGAGDADQFWSRLCDGRSQAVGIGRQFPEEESSEEEAPFMGVEVRGFDHRRALPMLSEEHAKRYNRDILVTMAAATGALHDADLAQGQYDPARMGLVVSSSRGPLGWWLNEANSATGSATKRALCGLPGSAATMSAIQLNLQGMVTTISNACIGGSQALELAANQIQSGDADMMLVAGYEFPLVPEIAATFRQLGVLAAPTTEPTEAMRPFDRNRSGFVLGEGAIVLCLERHDRALRRNARCYAELLAQRSINEAAHPLSMDESGKVAAGLVQRLLIDSRRRASEIGYVCGHGSATLKNDRAECNMLEQLLPDTPVEKRPPLGSVKPVFGHTLGATAIVNAAATAMMLHHQKMSPTPNCQQSADDCPGDHIVGAPRPSRLKLAVSMSHALGSQTAATLLSAA